MNHQQQTSKLKGENMSSNKVVHLVGAGPGDIDLMTVKSLRLIQEADVIIFDRLANPLILKEAPKGCEFIDVGKTDGQHPVKQPEINEIIYQSSLKYQNVVRLKGATLLFLVEVEKKHYILKREM